MKKCAKCNQLLPFEAFPENKQHKDGLGYYCKVCNRQQAKQWRIENPKKATDGKRRGRHAYRQQALEAYGSVCACCRETEPKFLTIDHIDRKGHSHKSKSGRRLKGTKLYMWLKANGYPKDNFQILCFNCNNGKEMNDGICPHQMLNTNTDME